MSVRGQLLVRTGVYLAVLLVYAFLASMILLVPLSLIPGVSQEDYAPAGGNSSLMLGLTSLVGLGVIAITHLFLRRWDRVRWRAVLLRGRALPDLLAGYGVALAFLALILVIMLLSGWLHIDGAGTLFSRGAGYAIGMVLFFIVGFLIQGGTEEVVCRGYLFRNLHVGLGFAAALVVSSVIFGIGHGLNPGVSALAYLNIFAIGLVFALLTIRGSLWVAIGMHGGWNLFLGLAGIPVSGLALEGVVRARLEGPEVWTGGAFGLEASLLTLIVSTTGCALLFLWPGFRAAVHRARSIHTAGLAREIACPDV